MPANSTAPRTPPRAREIEVLLEDTDSESGLILLSKRKADMIRGWEYIINTKKEGDVVNGQGHPPDQGRPARRYRRAGLPARLASRYSQARRHQPVHRQRSRVQSSQDRRGEPQHRGLAAQAHRRGAQGQQREDPQRDRGRPASQGHRQEHRRFRRVRRPRRPGRPAAHLRPELGPDFAPVGSGGPRPGNRVRRHRRGQREREDLPGPQAEVAEPVGERREQVPRRLARSRARSST